MRGVGYIGCAGVSCVTLPAWIGYDVVPWYIGLAPVGYVAYFWIRYLIEWWLYRQFWNRR